MSYHKAVIVPSSIFERCKFDTGPHDILFDPTLSTDVKLKLYNQNKRLHLNNNKSATKIQQITTKDQQILYTDKFILPIHSSVRPFAKSIFDALQKEPDISWSPDGEITIESQTYYGSNITDLLNYVLNQLIITDENDKPHGAIPFLQFLQKINIPKDWIKIRLLRRAKRKTISTPDISSTEESEKDASEQDEADVFYTPLKKTHITKKAIDQAKFLAKARKIAKIRKSARAVKQPQRLIEGHGKINWISL